MTAFQAEGCGGGFAADYKKASQRPPVISTEAERSGEIPPLMVRATLRREISRLRVSSKHFPSAPYQHAASLEMTVEAGSIGHTFGVKVQRVVVAADAADFKEKGCGSAAVSG